MMRLTFLRFFAGAMAFVFALGTGVNREDSIVPGFTLMPSAHAQSSGKPKTLFDVIFGKGKRVKKKAVKAKRKKRVKRKKTVAKRSKRKTTAKKKPSRTAARVSRPSIAAALQVPAVQEVAKIDNAKRVLVIGDFFAGGLADGLEKALIGNAVTMVTDKSKGLSGIVRDDVVNWPEVLPKLLDSEKPSFLIVMLGSNDRQLMLEGGKKLKTRTAEWDAAYKARVEKLAEALKQSGLPFIWVGLPPVRFGNMSKDYLVFNEWYREAATTAGGSYVDVWDGFSDAEGNYSRSGPDINGQIVLLRGKDGINLTKNGRRRLAFYVEKEVQKVLGGGGPSTSVVSIDDLSGVATSPSAPQYNPAVSGRTIVVKLDDPSSDGGTELAGAQPVAQTPDALLSLPQAASARHEERVDNYVWPPISGTAPGADDLVVEGTTNQ